MSTMEYIESLPKEEQDAIQAQYESYVKGSVSKGKEVKSPDDWLQEVIRIPVVDESRIRQEFKRIMIDNGHGSVMERALFAVKGI